MAPRSSLGHQFSDQFRHISDTVRYLDPGARLDTPRLYNDLRHASAKAAVVTCFALIAAVFESGGGLHDRDRQVICVHEWCLAPLAWA